MRTLSQVLVALFFMMLFVSPIATWAQDDEESPFSLGLTMESRYVWRGYNYNGAGPSLQPSISYSKGGFEIGAWGGYSIATGAPSETDVYISYTAADMVTFMITDFFYHNEGGTGITNQYFKYDQNHWIEASVAFAKEGFPLSFLAAVNVYGDKYTTDDEEEKEAYSAYLEATYSKEVKGVNVSAFAGFAIAPEESGWYTGYNGEGVTGFVNVGIGLEKELKVNDKFALPVHAKAIFNPAQENYYIVFGFSL